MPTNHSSSYSSLFEPLLALSSLLLRRLSAAVRHHRGRNTPPASSDVPPPPPPSSSPLELDRLYGRTVVVDVDAWLLLPAVDAFTFFMVVAVEAGGFLRGLLLLLVYPLLCLLLGDGDGGGGARARAMATVALVGLEEREVARVGRAVMPRLLMAAAAAEGAEAVRAARRSVAVSATLPRVMVEAFLREHVGVDAVVGPELRSVAGVVAGIMDDADAARVAARRLRALLGDEMDQGEADGAGAAVGLVGEGRSGGTVHYLFSPAALGKPVTAVTYSLSRVSEMIAPIRTARLTRDREEDRRSMAALLARGDLVVCPEGTTCREGYLLRFSPLFAELGADVNPVALDARVDMFHGTSTTPAAKWMDPFYFMMNPKPSYRVEFLPRAAPAPAAEDGGDSIRVANRVQRQIGEALGFELTGMTRKDKYMMLAGNEGVVAAAAAAAAAAATTIKASR
uniref:Glycerol-3-phosphate acyltransferase RAM2/GPAT1-8 HAD-like domain-containing protein n=1 Tax=Oryza barthii TaxID=65489 RepID=A0A0D3ELU4_9ORYZ